MDKMMQAAPTRHDGDMEISVAELDLREDLTYCSLPIKLPIET